MLDLAKEFSLLGFLEETEEDGTVTSIMDFPDDTYLTVTDDNGRAHRRLIRVCKKCGAEID